MYTSSRGRRSSQLFPSPREQGDRRGGGGGAGRGALGGGSFFSWFCRRLLNAMPPPPAPPPPFASRTGGGEPRDLCMRPRAGGDARPLLFEEPPVYRIACSGAC